MGEGGGSAGVVSASDETNPRSAAADESDARGVSFSATPYARKRSLSVSQHRHARGRSANSQLVTLTDGKPPVAAAAGASSPVVSSPSPTADRKRDVDLLSPRAASNGAADLSQIELTAHPHHTLPAAPSATPVAVGSGGTPMVAASPSGANGSSAPGMVVASPLGSDGLATPTTTSNAAQSDGSTRVHAPASSASASASASGSSPVPLPRPATRAPSVSAGAGAGVGAGLQVLVIDDSTINLRILCRMLESEGCVCVTAHDGQEAVDLVKKKFNNAQNNAAAAAAATVAAGATADAPGSPGATAAPAPSSSSSPSSPSSSAQFSLIFSDILMPVLDGLSACRSMRTFEATHGLPPTTICAVSANALLHDKQSCFEAGFSCHLAKPFSKAQIRKVISKYAKPGRALPASFDEFNHRL